MKWADEPGSLLSLDPGVRVTGWAIFCPGVEVATGVIGIPGKRGIGAQARLGHLTQGLDRLVERWHPVALVHSQPSGIHWPVPALEMLDAALREWCEKHQLPVFPYSAQEVRTALAGHPNASKEDLAYAVMSGLHLIGKSKSTHEWEAIAVGHYHLSRQQDDSGSSPSVTSW